MDLERHSRSVENLILCDKLILQVYLLHPVFLNDVLSDVVGKTIYLGLLHVYFLRQKIGDAFYKPPGITICCTAF